MFIQNNTTIRNSMIGDAAFYGIGIIKRHDWFFVGKNTYIMVTNAKFIMKPHFGAEEGFRVTTGNHVMIEGKFHLR